MEIKALAWASWRPNTSLLLAAKCDFLRKEFGVHENKGPHCGKGRKSSYYAESIGDARGKRPPREHIIKVGPCVARTGLKMNGRRFIPASPGRLKSRSLSPELLPTPAKARQKPASKRLLMSCGNFCTPSSPCSDPINPTTAPGCVRSSLQTNLSHLTAESKKEKGFSTPLLKRKNFCQRTENL
jgi:hypothetical protein